MSHSQEYIFLYCTSTACIDHKREPEEDTSKLPNVPAVIQFRTKTGGVNLKGRKRERASTDEDFQRRR